jgi:hypothetical protein
MPQNPHVLLTFDKVHNPVRLSREKTSERPKVVRACLFFNIFISKYASRHNGAHFFDISTPKGVFDILTSTCASRRNGVSFLIVQLTR